MMNFSPQSPIPGLHHQRIGLLGGSFNPAHAGHIHLSLEAIKRLKLDRVIWLVSPQNPLKSKRDIAPYDTRLQHAAALTRHHPHIHVSDFEQQEGLFFSIDTVAALQQTYPAAQLVWLMGADNLANFHRWRAWDHMFARIPIAVFDRAPFSHAALRSKAAIRYAQARLLQRDTADLPGSVTPAWTYVFMPRHPLSTTDLRKTLGKSAFLAHNEVVKTFMEKKPS